MEDTVTGDPRERHHTKDEPGKNGSIVLDSGGGFLAYGRKSGIFPGGFKMAKNAQEPPPGYVISVISALPRRLFGYFPF